MATNQEIGMKYPVKRHENEMMFTTTCVRMDVHPQKGPSELLTHPRGLWAFENIFTCHVQFQEKQWQKITIALSCCIASCIFEVLAGGHKSLLGIYIFVDHIPWCLAKIGLGFC